MSRWRAQRACAALEHAAAWLPPSQHADSSLISAAAGDQAGPPPMEAVSWLPPAKGYVDVCGVELPCREGSGGPGALPSSSSSKHKAAAQQQPGGSTGAGAFVATPSATRNLRAAALALCAGRPLLLEGPPGCGKTRMIEELAERTGNAAAMVGPLLYG